MLSPFLFFCLIDRNAQILHWQIFYFFNKLLLRYVVKEYNKYNSAKLPLICLSFS
jgi:hypothetical protein